MKKLFNGQINLAVAIIGAIGMIGASVFTSWTTANGRIWGVENKVNIVEERENLHYLEVQKQLEKIDKKLDSLLSIKESKK